MANRLTLDWPEDTRRGPNDWLGARSRSLMRVLPLGMALILVVVLATYNLQNYPRTWFDEGMNLDTAKNLAQLGRYGLQSSDGFRQFDSSVQTGPTVLVPVALIFKLFGVGLIQARLVMVAYLLFAAVGMYWTGKQLFDPAVGTVAILVFASATQFGPFLNGRDVLGEVPAVAFLCWGAGAFVRARGAKSGALYAGAGLLFGLAILTKSQFVLLVPLIPLLWLAGGLGAGHDRFPVRHLFLLVSALILPAALWYMYQLAMLGPDQFLAHMTQMSRQARFSSYVTPLSKTSGSISQLVSSSFGISGAGGLLYVWLITAREDWRGQPERLVLPGFVTLWLAWYVGLSIGWYRYAAPAAMLSSLFVAKLYCDLGRRFTPLGSAQHGLAFRRFLADPLGTALLVLLAMTLFAGVWQNGLAISKARDDSPEKFAALVTAQVPSNAVVESFEWEIDFLTSRTYHHPPVAMMDDATGVAFLGRSPETLKWYQVPPTVSYLIDGPMSKTGVYRPELQSGEFRRIASYGDYDLYKRVGAP